MRLIAEFCQNHNGDWDTLMRMIGAAAEGGATHGKIQTIFADDLSFRERFESGVTREDGSITTIKRPYRQEYDRLKKLELSFDQQARFVTACRAAGLEPMTTAFTLSSIPHLSQMGWRAIKVASYDCGSLPLIEALAMHFDEIIVSTGATLDDEIEATAAYLNGKRKNFSLLHCVTIYPTPLSEMHLARLDFLRGHCRSVGLSDHSHVAKDGVKAALAAVYMGAQVIERHFTILPAEETRDGPVSIRKEHLRTIADFGSLPKSDQKLFLDQAVPELSSLIGKRTRSLSREEMLNRDYYRGRFCNKVAGQQIYNWENEARSVLAHQAFPA